jgi:predicted SnoaL-like aldol condensation-catalyzing enzyme
MSEGNKAIIRRLVEELWSEGNLSIADEFFSQNYTHHDPSTPDFGQGPEGEKNE